MGNGPLSGWVPSVAGGLKRYLQTCHSVRRLKAVASSVDSALTFTSPRSKNRRAPSCSLRMPKMGSISPFRRAYRCRALSVVIQCRCWRGRASVGPIHNARPECNARLWCKRRKQGKRGTRSLRHGKLGMVPAPCRFYCGGPGKVDADPQDRGKCRCQHHRRTYL